MISAFTTSSGVLVANESAVVRLERGVKLMTEGKQLEDAILEFKAVLAAEKKSKKLSAEARYRLAKCYLKLNKTDDVKKQIDALKKGYASDNTWVKKGLVLYPSGPQFVPVPWNDGEFSIYDVKLANGEVVGQYYTIIKASEKNGKNTWTGYFTRTSGGLSQTLVEFNHEDFSLIQSRGFMQGLGSFEADFKEGKPWEVKNSNSGEVTATGEIAPGEKLFDNDQSVHLLRLLPNEIGDKVTLPLVVVFMGGSKLDFTIEAIAHEKITTELGEFDCVKYKTNINQEFWVQRDGTRNLVKMKLPGAYLELKEVRKGWNENTAVVLKSKNEHGKITSPKGAIKLPVTDNKKVYRCRLTDSKLRFQLGLIELQDTKNFLKSVRGKNKETVKLLFKNMTTEAIGIQVDENKWQDLSRKDEVKATLGVCKVTQGELEHERILLSSNINGKTLVLTFDCNLGESNNVIKLAQEMFESWEK